MESLKRNMFVPSTENRLRSFLDLFGLGGEGMYKSELQEKCFKNGITLSTATFKWLVIDALLMGLISNGGKYRITELGQDIKFNPNDRGYWKKAMLNVPIYKAFHEKYGEEKNINIFLTWAYQNYQVSRHLVRLFGMGTRRYFEIYHQLTLPKRVMRPRLKIRARFKKVTSANVQFSNITSSELQERNLYSNTQMPNGKLNEEIVDRVLILEKKIMELVEANGKGAILKILEKN